MSYLPQLIEILSTVLSSSANPLDVVEFLDRNGISDILLDYDLSHEKYFQSLTEFLNKLVDLNGETLKISTTKTFITTLIVDPRRAIKGVQKNCLTDSQLVANGLKILELFKGYVSNFTDDLLADLMKFSNAECDSLKGLENYIVEMFTRDFLDKPQFLKGVLFPELLKVSEDAEQNEKTLVCLSILNGILSRGSITLTADLRAPFIVGLGQVADGHRWDLMGYSDAHERIVSMATDLIGVVGSGDPLQGKRK